MESNARREYNRSWYHKTKELRRERINQLARESSRRRLQFARDNPDHPKSIHYKKQRRKHQVKHYYGLSEVEYQALGSSCMICGREDSLHIDHSHATGKVRGLLCMTCNHGLGNFKDDSILLSKAIIYLADCGS